MDPILIFMTYRMLIVLGGILCIYLGYRLFYIAQEKQGEFKVKYGEDTELHLSQVAPGVFFALFGAGVLVFCLTNGVSLKPASLVTKEIGLGADVKNESLPQSEAASNKEKAPPPSMEIVVPTKFEIKVSG